MIRQFHPQDASACSTLIRCNLERDPSYSPSLLWTILTSETPQAMIKRARIFYTAVYETEAGILGVGGLEMNEIRLLYVSLDYQRQGIGQALLAHLKEMVPQALFADIFVYSTQQSVPFYEACGFLDRGPCTFEIEGQELRTVFMTCPIPQDRLL